MVVTFRNVSVPKALGFPEPNLQSPTSNFLQRLSRDGEQLAARGHVDDAEGGRFDGQQS